MASQNAEPPLYVLVAHSTLPTQNPSQSSSTLVDPVIQYHFADDDPRALLPDFPGETVIVLDYHPDFSEGFSAQVLSGNSVVTGVQVKDATSGGESIANKNEKMHIIDLVSTQDW